MEAPAAVVLAETAAVTALTVQVEIAAKGKKQQPESSERKAALFIPEAEAAQRRGSVAPVEVAPDAQLHTTPTVLMVSRIQEAVVAPDHGWKTFSHTLAPAAPVSSLSAISDREEPKWQRIWHLFPTALL